MTNTQLALLFSAAAVGISLFSLGWNIFRDVVLVRARVRVTFHLGRIYQRGEEPSPLFCMLGCVNHGPTGDVRIMSIIARNTEWQWRWPFRKKTYYFVAPDYDNPLNVTMSKDLHVGEGLDHLLPYGQDCQLFTKSGFTHIGFSDSFNRKHWAPRKDVQAAWEEFRKDFPDATPPASSPTAAASPAPPSRA